MKVIIYTKEVNHYSLINSLIKIIGDHEIVVVVTELIKNNIDRNLNVKLVKRNDENIYSIFDIKHLRKFDLIIYDEPFSLKDISKLFFINLFIKFRLIVHNANTWIIPSYTLNLKNNIYLFIANNIIKRNNKIIVVGSNIKRYIEYINSNISVSVIPFNLNDTTLKQIKLKTDKIIISIPGNITFKRDYLPLLESFDKNGLFEIVNLQLLGSPVGEYGRKVIKYCSELAAKGANIKYYNSFVDNVTFENDIIKSDLLCAYFDVNFKTFRGQHEVYGKSKETGISFLSWRYGIPALLPINYNPIDEIKDQVIHYSNLDNLSIIIKSLTEYNKIEDLKCKSRNNVFINFEKYELIKNSK